MNIIFEVNVVHPHGFKAKGFLTRGVEIVSFKKNGTVVRVTSRLMYDSAIGKHGKPVSRGMGPINSSSNKAIGVPTVCPREAWPNKA